MGSGVKVVEEEGGKEVAVKQEVVVVIQVRHGEGGKPEVVVVIQVRHGEGEKQEVVVVNQVRHGEGGKQEVVVNQVHGKVQVVVVAPGEVVEFENGLKGTI